MMTNKRIFNNFRPEMLTIGALAFSIGIVAGTAVGIHMTNSNCQIAKEQAEWQQDGGMPSAAQLNRIEHVVNADHKLLLPPPDGQLPLPAGTSYDQGGLALK